MQIPSLKSASFELLCTLQHATVSIYFVRLCTVGFNMSTGSVVTLFNAKTCNLQKDGTVYVLTMTDYENR